MRKLRQQTAPEFLAWMEDFAFDTWHDKKALFADFTGQFPDFKEGRNMIEQRTLTTWLKRFAASNSMEVGERKSGKDRQIVLISGHPGRPPP